MHCELVIPALFAVPPGARLPALEMLLARARESRAEPQSLAAWLAGAFDADEPLAAGALTARAADLPGVEGAAWGRADPVHLRLLRDRLVLVPGQAFPLSMEEASALCEALNRHFGETFTLHAVRPERWCARLAHELVLDAPCPLDMAGREIKLGDAIGKLQSVMNEAQMLLHGHPVNEAREARGEPPVNSLWFWGGGVLPAQAEGPWQAVLADEPLALGLARIARLRNAATPADAESWLDRVPSDGRYLIVLDALRVAHALAHEADHGEALQALEKKWFAPLLDALRAGRIGMVSVHIPDAGASFEAIRGDLRRFWRRPRAIEHYA